MFKPMGCLFDVFMRSLPLQVRNTKIKLGQTFALFGRLLKPVERLNKVTMHTNPIQIDPSQIGLSNGISLAGRLAKLLQDRDSTLLAAF